MGERRAGGCNVHTLKTSGSVFCGDDCLRTEFMAR